MKEIEKCRNMERLSRQRASFFPEQSWKHLAEAEMWQHKALDFIAQRHSDANSRPMMVDVTVSTSKEPIGSSGSM